MKIAFRILFTALLFFVLFYYFINFNTFLEKASTASISYLFIGLIILFLSVFITAYRWKKILNIKGYDIPFLVILKEYYIGHFFNNFLPTSVGGDVVRSIAIAKYTNSKTIVFSSVAVERITGLLALLLIGNIGVLILELENNYYIALVSLIGVIFVSVVFFALIYGKLNTFFSNIFEKYFGKLGGHAKGFLSGFYEFSKDRKKLLSVFFISVIFKLLEGLFVYFVVLSLNVEFSYFYTLVLFAVVSILKFIPISLNGLGLSEISWVTLTMNASILPETAASISLLIYFSGVTMSLVGGVFYLLRKNK